MGDKTIKQGLAYCWRCGRQEDSFLDDEWPMEGWEVPITWDQEGKKFKERLLCRK